jgi:hypothetical protein
MKILLINNTSASFPLTGGIPNLGPYARQTIEITTSTFEDLRSHLDQMKTKGLISYSTDLGVESPSNTSELTGDSELKEAKNALQLLRTDLTANNSDYISKLKDVEASFLSEISALRSELATLRSKVDSPKELSFAFRSEAKNAISMSRGSYEPMNGVSLAIPSTGNWMALIDVVIHSPVPSKGHIALNYTDSLGSASIVDGTERTWVRQSDLSSSVYFTVSLNLKEGDMLSIVWKAMEGTLRANYRSISLIKL